MSHEDVKPNPAQLDGQPTLRVTLASPGMSEPITIRAKSSTAVSKLINAFANNQGINAATIRLVTPEGERMRPQQTLGDYGIEDNDRLDVLIEQIGGH